MKNKLRQEKGITMMALVVTIIILLILTSVLVFNTQDSVYIKRLNNLYSDIELLRAKTDEYYNEYGQIPAKIKYENKIQLEKLKNVRSTKNDTGNFYVIDLEAMEGITLNYGKDYENVKNLPKNEETNANNYTDLYIINENSHNIFFVRGIEIKEKDTVKTYYTDYTKPDETTVDIRYVDGILIPDGYYYIGKTKDSSGNETIVISNNKEENVNLNQTNQFTWEKQISQITEVPSSVILEKLENNQEDYQFIASVNNFKGYFKNTAGNVRYVVVNEEQWSEAYTKDTEYKDKNGDTVTIPEGFKISMADTMNTVKKGLVVKDENDNEWVWIEVPEDVFTTANNDTDYDKIGNDLITYAQDYRNGSSTQTYEWKDTWYEGCGLTEDEYSKLYKSMLTSLYNNNGFWMSRYEAGIDGSDENLNLALKENINISSTTPRAVSKKDMIPYNFVTCSQAQKLASKMSTSSNKTSSLLFGIQWDLACKFLEENSNLDQSDIKTDSCKWGNYSNTQFKITSGNTKQYISSWKLTGKVQKENVSLLSTGAAEYTRVLNIYDFAGNEWEWTLECTTNNGSSLRGGAFANLGNVNSASSRGMNSKENSIYYTFRAVLY